MVPLYLFILPIYIMVPLCYTYIVARGQKGYQMIVKYKSLTKKQKYEYIANQMKLAEQAYLKRKEKEVKRGNA